MQVDIGFTDIIIPSALDLHYPVLLSGMEAPQLRGYSPESIISEKFHAMVFLAEANDRLKDFYDIWMLSESCNFDGTTLQEAINITFRKRLTEIPVEVPVALSDAFVTARQADWKTFLARNKITVKNIDNLSFLVGRLRIFLMPLLQALTTKQSFAHHWNAGHEWN